MGADRITMPGHIMMMVVVMPVMVTMITMVMIMVIVKLRFCLVFQPAIDIGNLCRGVIKAVVENAGPTALIGVAIHQRCARIELRQPRLERRQFILIGNKPCLRQDQPVGHRTCLTASAKRSSVDRPFTASTTVTTPSISKFDAMTGLPITD